MEHAACPSGAQGLQSRRRVRGELGKPCVAGNEYLCTLANHQKPFRMIPVETMSMRWTRDYERPPMRTRIFSYDNRPQTKSPMMDSLKCGIASDSTCQNKEISIKCYAYGRVVPRARVLLREPESNRAKLKRLSRLQYSMPRKRARNWGQTESPTAPLS